MNSSKALQRMEEITKHYLEEVNHYSLEQLKLQPSENEWSLGQVYIHLINAALYMQLRNIDRCRDQEANSMATSGEKTEAGKMVFEAGGFPPVSIQIPPSPEFTPGQPISKEQIIEGMNTVLKRMQEIEHILQEIDLNHTVPHPRLGALHAKEWFLLSEMHYRHHLRQKERLKKFLESNK